MPSFCAIVGCGSRGQRDVKSFFRLPAVITNQGGKTEELSRRRRSLWLLRIARNNLRDSTLSYIRVCSDHFVSGRPCALYDDSNLDWAPSIKLGNTGMDQETRPAGCSRKRKKKHKREKILEQVAASALLDLGDAAHEDNENNEHRRSAKVQTDLTSESITAMQLEMKRLLEENRNLRKDVAALKLKEF